MSEPLSLLEVLVDEHRALGVRPHLKDPVALFTTLLVNPTPFAINLHNQLSPTAKGLLALWSSHPDPAGLRDVLVDDLDRLLSLKRVTRADLQREFAAAFVDLPGPVRLADCYRIDTATLAEELKRDTPLARRIRAQLSPTTGAAPPAVALVDLDRLVLDEVITRAELVAEYPAAFRAHPDIAPGLAKFYDWIHRLRNGGGSPRTALCLSGGGIRSATFGLGVLQALADYGLLPRFDFLSTVSGGGYIGSWLSAWIHRHSDGRAGVSRDLKTARTDPLAPEPEPIRRLRAYSNYLTPRAGLFSIDTWTGIASYLRNLVLNWLVLLPILMLLLALPRLAVAVVHRLSSTPPTVAAVTSGLAVLLVLVTIRYMASERPSLGRAPDGGGDPAAIADRYRRGFWVRCLGPLVLAATLLAFAWSQLNYAGCGVASLEALAPGVCGMLSPTALLVLLFALGGAAVHLLAYLLYAHRLRRHPLPEGWRVVLSGAVGGVLSWLAAVKMSGDWKAAEHTAAYVVFGLPAVLAIVLLTATFFVGLMSRLMDDEDREWSARFGGYVVALLAGWIMLSGLALFGPYLLDLQTGGYKPILGAVGGASGVMTLFKGWSSKTSSTGGATRPSGLSAVLLRNALTIVAGIFAAAVAIVLSWTTSALMVRILSIADDIAHPTHHDVLMRATVAQTLGTMIALIVIGWGMARVINANKFSLHGMYRNRLIRAYLGASRMVRTPNPFTGFDPNDNVEMSRLRTELRLEIGDVDVAAFAATISRVPPASTAHRATLTGLRRTVSAYLSRRPPAVPPLQRAHACVGALLRDETRTMLQGDGQGFSPALRAALLEDLNVGIYANHAVFPHEVVSALLSTEVAQAYDRADLDVEDRAQIHRDVLTASNCGIAPRQSTDQRPLHVVNIALNLVAGRDLAWQERKAESFTVSPLAAGCWRLGYRHAAEYGRGRIGRSISLGTAVAISGAAASPNQGYHSSPLVTFLMALFNVRLGWWLGNPGRFGNATYRAAYPANSASPVLRETLGLTDDESPFVYLSDGGHFENLALYEMVLRRCHVIVLSDAGCDPACSLDDLGNAIRKIRIDFGIPITFDEPFNVRARPLPPAAPGHPAPPPVLRYCAVGTIDYGVIDGPNAGPGTLIYVKPAFYGEEPRDVFNYATANPAFPHESTANQWFTESQFESYRMLGRYALHQVGDPAVTTFKGLCAHARAYARGPATSSPPAAPPAAPVPVGPLDW